MIMLGRPAVGADPVRRRGFDLWGASSLASLTPSDRHLVGVCGERMEIAEASSEDHTLVFRARHHHGIGGGAAPGPVTEGGGPPGPSTPRTVTNALKAAHDCSSDGFTHRCRPVRFARTERE